MARPTSSRFFELSGRATELEALHSWYRSNVASAPTVMVVSGVAGIGKTHLCSAFLADLAPEAISLVGLSAPGQAANNPFESLTQALLDVAAQRGVSVPASVLENLSALRPNANDGVSAEPNRPLDASRFGDRPHHRGFVELTQLLALHAPVVLLIDDLQWVSPPSIHLLRHLLNNPKPHPVHLLATCRPTPSAPVESLLAELELLGMSHAIELQGLTETEVAELLTTRGASESDLASNAAALTSLTSGNPLLIETALAASSGERPALPGGSGLSTLADSFAAFPVATQRVLAQLGVFGRSQSLTAIAEALGTNNASHDLKPAAVAGWVEFHPNTQAAGFTHDEFREAALQAQSPDELMGLHRAAARILVGNGDNESDLVFHLTEANADTAEVTHVALTAARKAMQRQAFQEAAQLFSVAMPEALALNATTTQASPEQPTGTAASLGVVDDLSHHDLIDLAECLRRTNHPSAFYTIGLAFESSRRRDDFDGMVRTALLQTRIGEFSALGAVEETVVSNLEYVLERIDPSKRAADTALILSALVEELLFGPIAQNRYAMSQRAIDLATESGDDQAIFVAHLAQRNAYCQPDQLDLRIKAGHHLAELASAADNQWGLALAHLLLAGNLLERGDRAGCEMRLDLGQAANAELQSPALAYIISSRRTALLVMDGNFEAAQTAVLADLRLGEIADLDPYYTFGIYGGQALLISGSMHNTSELIDAFKIGMESRPDFLAFGAACAVAMAQANDPRAGDLVDSLSADNFESVRFDYFWILTIAMIGRAALVVDRHDVSDQAFELLAPYSGRLVWSGAAATGPVDWYLGIFAGVRGRTDEALRYLHRARQQCAQLGMIPIGVHVDDDIATISAAKPNTPIPGALFRGKPWPR